MAGCATLAAYGGALEMGFEANLLLSLWAVVFSGFEERLRGFRDAHALLEADDEHLSGEEISKRHLKETIETGSAKTRWWWWRGLVVGVGSALVYYLIAWFVVPSWPNYDVCVFGPLWWPLVTLAFLSPAIMLRMAVVGWSWSKTAKSQVDELEQEAEKRRRTGHQAFSHLQEVGSPVQPPRSQRREQPRTDRYGAPLPDQGKREGED